MHVFILSGGVGSRLWPKSAVTPKQFMQHDTDHSLIQSTFLRSLKLNPSTITNITNQHYILQTQKELGSIEAQHQANMKYIVEPYSRNTAFSVAIASVHTLKKYDEDLIVILPSDHYIPSASAFCECIQKGIEKAHDNKVVIFAVKPSYPEVGYGYIKYNSQNDIVEQFVEKPDVQRAAQYVASGEYFWNTGMLCFKASVMIEEMRRFCPDILEVAQECYAKSNLQDLLYLNALTSIKAREESVDFAVLEKSDAISMVECNLKWSDVGCWRYMSAISQADLNGNVINGASVTTNVRNCYINSSNRLVAALGVEDLIIVDSPNALLVANKNDSQQVKNLMAEVKLYEQSYSDVRPWGKFTVLSESANYKVKLLEVNPGEELSLQKHKYRQEHWTIVSGAAEVILDDKILILSAGDFVKIDVMQKHKLKNMSLLEKLEVIEVQLGELLSEDDIERLEDKYFRC